ncbi:GNAT family N-acetyltransferase [Glaciihabitans sp. dw_435]|uniref:GNAT family N-acetyltransferase n=1 Tax=Glaciihabitans sp. dw_435 TaxID=2720081 RepID=UPI001BD40528|nr:GNAT family N-acetyltransferase [Glaciihabitans sp. dw_435]
MTATVSVDRVEVLRADAPERALAVAHAQFEKSTIVIPADWAARTSRLIAAGQLDLFVARSSGQALGYATLTRGVSTWAAEPYGYLDCLFVAEGHRDAGVGPLLVTAVAEHARSVGLRELQWQTPSWNAGAIRFYTRLGAARSGKEHFALRLE